MFEKLKRALQALKEPAPPRTWISAGGSKTNYFTERQRNKEQLQKYRTIYEQGGIFSEAIDSYALFTFANGWRLEGENQNLVDDVWAWLESFDLDYVMEQGLVDALVYGDGFQENIFNRGSKLDRVVARESWSFDIIHDDHGVISGYKQQLGLFENEYVVELEPKSVTHVQIKALGGSVYGTSLIGRAFDEIMRDTKTAESSATAVERHGFKKYHIRVGKEGEVVPQDVILDISKLFQTLETKNEFTTVKDVEIKNIDEGGLEKIDTYNDISIMRVCAALGVPEETLGLRRGSTDATAVSRIQAFYKKIARIQKRLERIYSHSVIDQYTQQPGAVRLVYSDVDITDEVAKSKWIAEIMNATKLDPFAVLPRKWIQEQFNIEVEEELPEEIEKI